MTREEALEYVNNMWMSGETHDALETLIPEFGKTGSDKIMDYEKKYNEALERAKKFEEKYGGGYAEYIFPELAESEDERIIKTLQDYVKNRNWPLNGPTQDEVLAWLEKQKEQKPNIELIQRSWYMEGYHDREFGKEPKWIIKTGEGGPKHELNPRYGQPLTEQRPTEEQLHNLNEAIKSYRMDGFDKIADSLHSLYNILTTQAQKPAWSEEDEEKIVTISEIIEHCTTIPYSGGTLTLNKEYKKELLCFIKSLRPQYHGDVTMTEAYKMGKEAGEASHWKPSEDELTKKHLEGYIKGRNDALREISDFMESHFNTQIWHIN